MLDRSGLFVLFIRYSSTLANTPVKSSGTLTGKSLVNTSFVYIVASAFTSGSIVSCLNKKIILFLFTSTISFALDMDIVGAGIPPNSTNFLIKSTLVEYDNTTELGSIT